MFIQFVDDHFCIKILFVTNGTQKTPGAFGILYNKLIQLIDQCFRLIGDDVCVVSAEEAGNQMYLS